MLLRQALIDRFSDDVQVNISSSLFRDEGHLNIFVTESKVGPRSSEVKVPQVEQEVVMGVGDPQSTPRIDTADAEIVFKPTTGMIDNEHTTQTNGRHYVLKKMLILSRT